MATQKFSVGIFYKKIVNALGQITGYQPMLMKTLAKLVYTNDGTTVQQAITTMSNDIGTNADTIAAVNKKTKYYENLAAYKADVQSGTNLTGVVCVIKDGPNVP